MQIDQARILAQALAVAIRHAETTGATEVALSSHLHALDDQARAELQAAIDAAKRA